VEDWVFVDTVIWAAFFTKPGSTEKKAVDELIDADRVALIGPVVAEVLRGFRRKDQADWVASRLRLAHYATTEWDDWRDAAELGRNLAAKGHDLPITDLILAAIALRLGASVYSSDPDFDLIEDLRRYSSGTS